MGAGPKRNPLLRSSCVGIRQTEVGAALAYDAEATDTEEMLSSSKGGEGVVSAEVLNNLGMGH